MPKLDVSLNYETVALLISGESDLPHGSETAIYQGFEPVLYFTITA